MSDFSMLRALEASQRVAQRLGFGEVEPLPLRISDHVSLYLPAVPAVARVKPAAAEAAMRRELDVVSHLASKGAPVVPPLSGAHVEQGCVLSFWQWVPHRSADPGKEDHRQLAVAALRQVHGALSDYSGWLPTLEDKVEDCCALLRTASLPGLSEQDRHYLLEIAEELRGWKQEEVPLHGDAGFHNLFITGEGALWTDFAAACRGPRGWDLSSLGMGDDPVLSALRSFCVSVWCWNLAEDPGKREAANLHLN
ncbi:MAG TPA: aminoglycoside phosphotransferase family protein, partial [Magnetospirillaceae bacterium]|nr:aminoglycoside phosphotransferase family protein [Magnetospirillaceae bacterium]